jgi:hypothetical protein
MRVDCPNVDSKKGVASIRRRPFLVRLGDLVTFWSLRKNDPYATVRIRCMTAARLSSISGMMWL